MTDLLPHPPPRPSASWQPSTPKPAICRSMCCAPSGTRTPARYGACPVWPPSGRSIAGMKTGRKPPSLGHRQRPVRASPQGHRRRHPPRRRTPRLPDQGAALVPRKSHRQPGAFKLDVGVLDTGITELMYAELERLIDDAKGANPPPDGPRDQHGNPWPALCGGRLLPRG